MTFPPHIAALRNNVLAYSTRVDALDELCRLAAQAPAPPEPPLTTVRGWAPTESLRSGFGWSGFSVMHERPTYPCVPVAVVPLSPDGGLTQELFAKADAAWQPAHSLCAALRAVLGVEEGR